MDDLTTTARQILTLAREDRAGAIEQHPDPEALKAEIIRLWTKHKAFIVHADGHAFSMIPSQPMTLDDALEHARGQFGRERVESVEEFRRTVLPTPPRVG